MKTIKMYKNGRISIVGYFTKKEQKEVNLLIDRIREANEIEVQKILKED